MNEEAEPRQSGFYSAETVAYRAEQKAMLPFRKRIGQLQAKVAFAVARASSSRSPSAEEVEADILEIASRINETVAEIDELFPGPSHGPADNCRRALEVVRQRLEGLFPKA